MKTNKIHLQDMEGWDGTACGIEFKGGEGFKVEPHVPVAADGDYHAVTCQRCRRSMNSAKSVNFVDPQASMGCSRDVTGDEVARVWLMTHSATGVAMVFGRQDKAITHIQKRYLDGLTGRYNRHDGPGTRTTWENPSDRDDIIKLERREVWK